MGADVNVDMVGKMACFWDVQLYTSKHALIGKNSMHL